jgi:hypothetical protein
MLKREYKVIMFLQISVNIYQPTCPNIPEDVILEDIDSRLVTLPAAYVDIKMSTAYTKADDSLNCIIFAPETSLCPCLLSCHSFLVRPTSCKQLECNRTVIGSSITTTMT